MRAPILLVLFVLHVAYATVVYEYGTDSPYAELVDYRQGKIKFLELNTKVKVNVPSCYELRYVKVEVDNNVSLPHIKYQKETQTVQIVYNLFSDSRSTYKVYVKAVRVCRNSGQYDQSPYSVLYDGPDVGRSNSPVPVNQEHDGWNEWYSQTYLSSPYGDDVNDVTAYRSGSYRDDVSGVDSAEPLS